MIIEFWESFKKLFDWKKYNWVDEVFQVEYLWTFGWHHNIKQITYRALHKGWNTGLPFIVDQKFYHS